MSTSINAALFRFFSCDASTGLNLGGLDQRSVAKIHDDNNREEQSDLAARKAQRTNKRIRASSQSCPQQSNVQDEASDSTIAGVLREKASNI